MRPICDFVEKYAESDTLRFHMPGHKGRGDEMDRHDITEIAGADSLFEADGIISDSETAASRIFSAKTFYSTEGSSLSIRAMLYLAMLYAKENGKKPKILAARNVHKSFVSAVSLLDIDVEWIYPEGSESYLSSPVCPEVLDKLLSSRDEKPTALYITSPDYLGVCSDVIGLSEVCHKHGLLLLVDNAHGAYLRFLEDDLHPITLGADVVCDSAHKTLPVLTGGAYLHISKNAPDSFSERAKAAMALFASTSPSYLTLCSLDAANDYLEDNMRTDLSLLCKRVGELKNNLVSHGYTIYGDEPIKLTIKTKPYGYLGTDFAELLRESMIECEFCDKDFVVLMLSTMNGNDEIDILEKKLLDIPMLEPIMQEPPVHIRPRAVMTPRDASMRPFVELPVDDCIGKVLATMSLSCPPAVPILVSGELIEADGVTALKYYGIEKCLVVE